MKQPQYNYAGRLERLLAYLLDTLAVLSISTFLEKSMGKGDVATLFVLACLIAYHIVPLASDWQATLGQRLLSIHIVRLDGKRIDTTAAFVRFLAFIMPSLPLYSTLLSPDIAGALAGALVVFWFAPILFTPDRAGIHDQLCYMRVVAGKRGERPA